MQRKIVGMVLAAMAVLWISGCSKQPFKEVQTAPGKSVVYVYWLEPVNQEHAMYDVVIGNKVVGTVHNNCYIAAEVDAGPVMITVRDRDPIKGHLKKAQLHVDAVASSAAYIRIDSPFSASVVDSAVGSREIKGTELWEEFDATFHMAGEEEPTEAKPSVAEEIERLFALKEKGAITEEEYHTLKARAISK